jgi:hypothetical protein
MKTERSASTALAWPRRSDRRVGTPLAGGSGTAVSNVGTATREPSPARSRSRLRLIEARKRRGALKEDLLVKASEAALRVCARI